MYEIPLQSVTSAARYILIGLLCVIASVAVIGLVSQTLIVRLP